AKRASTERELFETYRTLAEEAREVVAEHLRHLADEAGSIIAAGIARVVVATDDPDPRVAGRGYALLRAAGIKVDTGILTAAAWPGLRPHLTR
ncbi:hypothetical protein J8J27_26360, partial [Mycobacterium tuberculosis]|nr:hypothetical protein [Mycobacterium tuberculosis]